MQTYIILLRGVMPTGKNKVPMAPLRDALTAAGLVDVRTYIQSGNVIARSDRTAADVEKLVHDEIEKQFGGDIAVVARTPGQMRQIFENRPYQEADTSKVYFTVLGSKPDADKVAALRQLDFTPDHFTVTDQAVYMCIVRMAMGRAS
ncbi:MAG TPA: DUF1697 domain-containing protein [Aggregatilineaceae bacterium]|nr:DUF1697 domain-containing protein [Aggregatilineaceae bacterium]